MSAVDALSGVLSSALFGALSGGPVVLLRGIGPACFDRAIGGGLRLTAAAVAVSLAAPGFPDAETIGHDYVLAGARIAIPCSM